MQLHGQPSRGRRRYERGFLDRDPFSAAIRLIQLGLQQRSHVALQIRQIRAKVQVEGPLAFAGNISRDDDRDRLAGNFQRDWNRRAYAVPE